MSDLSSMAQTRSMAGQANATGRRQPWLEDPQWALRRWNGAQAYAGS